MFKARLTRKEFLKTGLLGIIVMLMMPILKMFNSRENVSHKDARYYENLAG